MLPESIVIRDPRQVKGRPMAKGAMQKRAPKRGSAERNQFQEYLDELSDEPPFTQVDPDSIPNSAEDAYGVQLRSRNATAMDNSHSQPILRLPQGFQSETKGMGNQS